MVSILQRLPVDEIRLNVDVVYIRAESSTLFGMVAPKHAEDIISCQFFIFIFNIHDVLHAELMTRFFGLEVASKQW